MAKKSTTTNKATKPVKAGITKRKPVKAKASLANISSPHIDRDLVFLWKCIKMSTGMKIDWPAVAKDAGKSVGTVQKQWSRLISSWRRASPPSTLATPTGTRKTPKTPMTRSRWDKISVATHMVM
ncbi:unnamed protein product [Penicillium discolor]